MILLPFDILNTPQPVGVVPVLVGPLQALIAILPGLLLALGTAILALFKPSTFKKLLQLLWSQKIPVILIAGAITGMVYAWPVLFPPPKAVVTELAAGTDWPIWRGGADRRGWVQSTVKDPAHGGVRWTLTDGDISTFYASPAVVGNRVYTTSAFMGPFSEEGAIYSIDADTGKIVWRYDATDTLKKKKYRATFSSPSVSGRYLVVGEGLHETRDARVFCIDVEASETKREGVRLWSFETKSHVESSPAIADGIVVIGAGDDGLYCFALEGDNAGGAKELWHLAGERYPDCEGSPVIANGKVYFTLGIGGNAVVCVNARDGKEIWRHDTGFPVFGSPTLVGKKLVVGMGPGNFVQSAEEVAAAEREKLRAAGKSDADIEAAIRDIRPFGKVLCVDADSGDTLWEVDVERTILGAIAAADDKLYFGSRDGNVYCVTTDGKRAGKWDAHSPLVTSPAVARDHVYIISRNGQLYALDRASMKLAWELDLNTTSMSSPTVAHGHVYVGTDTNGLVCAGEPGGMVAAPVWRGAMGGPGRCGWTTGSLIGDRGTFAWRYPESAGEDADDGGSTAVRVTAPVALYESALYVGIDWKRERGLVRLQLAERVSLKPERVWLSPTKNAVSLSAAVTETLVCVVDGKPGDEGRELKLLEPMDGHAVGRRGVAPQASGEFVIARDRVFIADRPDGLSCISLDGDTPGGEAWSRKLGAVAGVPASVDDLLFVAVEDHPSTGLGAASPSSRAALLALDLPTGGVLWRGELAAAPASGPVVAENLAWVGTSKGLEAHDLVTGERAVSFDCGGIIGPIFTNGTTLYAVTSKKELVRVNLSDRTLLPAISGVDARMFPPMVTPDAVLYYDGKAILRQALNPKAGEKPETWLKLSWMGKMTSPMIVMGTHAFFGTSELGLVSIKPPDRK